MAHSHPSIQSFYKREEISTTTATASPSAPSEPSAAGDGFTEEELSVALDPLARKWNPDREYVELTIANLAPGPKAVNFMGRIVSLSTYIGQTAKQPKAKGCHHLVIADGSGAIALKLYFANNSFPLRLGQLISVWTAFISDTSKEEPPKKPMPPVVTMANIFPGRNTSDHVMIHTHKGSEMVCRLPLGYEKGKSLPALMTLESYTSSGHDGVPGAKILLCVRSIGPKKNITRRDGSPSELVEVTLFDHTGEIRFRVWNETVESAREWQAGKTILLLTSPAYKALDYGRVGTLQIDRNTLVDVDPDFADADWLRRFAVGLTKKEGLCLEVPEGLWDGEAEGAMEEGCVALFKLADVDAWVRENPSQVFTGWINVVIMDMALVQNYRRNMLFCTECCGIPIFANTLTTTCAHCDTALTLKLNPKIIGTLVDETGCIAPGKLVWSDRAWQELLGRGLDAVVGMTVEEVRGLEQRMCFMRMHLCFGWEVGVGRLCVLGMRM